MDINEFDVANIIKTRILLEKRLGSQAGEILLESFKSIPDGTTMRIDLTGADVIDYNFCSTAIGPLIKSLNKPEFKKKYVIIKADPDQKDNLLDGILFYISGIRSGKKSTESFIENNLSIKLHNAETDELEFIGKLNDIQNNILNLINNKNELTINDIAKEIDKTVELTHKNLEELEKQFFIYTKQIENEVFYCSFLIH